MDVGMGWAFGDRRRTSGFWSNSRFGPTVLLVRRFFWSDDSFGPTVLLVRRFFWSNGSFGPTVLLVRRFFWSNGSFGPTVLLVRRFFWSDGSFGPFGSTEYIEGRGSFDGPALAPIEMQVENIHLGASPLLGTTDSPVFYPPWATACISTAALFSNGGATIVNVDDEG